MKNIDKVKYKVTSKDCQACDQRKNSLLKDIPKSSLHLFQSDQREQQSFSARSIIFEEGKKNKFIYTLLSGWGIIYKTVSNNGKRQILRFILPGDLIGLQTNTHGYLNHSASTITQSVLCSFPRKEIKPMLKKHPELAIRLLEMDSKDMSLCQNHLIATGRKTAKESIAYVLLELFFRVKKQIPQHFISKTNSIKFPITQEDLADAVGLTNIHVNRVMKELMSEKLITCHKRNLSILNERKLSKLAGFQHEMI